MDQIGALAATFPRRVREHDWRIVYSLDLHGASLRSLYHQARLAKGPCILLCMDTWSYAFGAFLNVPPRTCGLAETVYGNGECFLFTFEPEFEAFRWSKRNEIHLALFTPFPRRFVPC